MYGPDSHFDFPLCPELDVPAPWASGPPPKTRKIIHYSHELTLAAPVLTSPALLATTVRLGAVMDRTPPQFPANFPLNREMANALGITGPTLEDVREFHYNIRPRFVDRCHIYPDESDRATSSGSIRHDEDWSRLVSCHDPWMKEPPLRGKVFTVGALSGCWTGRYCVRRRIYYYNNVAKYNLLLDARSRTILELGSRPSPPVYICSYYQSTFKHVAPGAPLSEAWRGSSTRK